ncbi:MAG: M23 family metallopeptidase [Oscillospiraceae bacterium]|nr:M23 family metallopeptidase [Oscillospiraceae bacterium]
MINSLDKLTAKNKKHKLRIFNIVLTKKNIIFYTSVIVIFLTAGILFVCYGIAKTESASNTEASAKDYIKWMEFNVQLSTLQKALKYDIDSYGTETPLNWIELISYAATENWGNVKQVKKMNKNIDDLVKKLRGGATIGELTENNKNMKLYPYYYETFYSVLGGFVGEYEVIEPDPSNPLKEITTKKYGLKVFSPVAKGYGYTHYEDFGASRSYGYSRPHTGNDLLGNVGTPIIAVEDGYVEAIGWNQYGGWRIGIRTYDKKRYYYYAHLRKDHPFVPNLKEGDAVHAGDVIGYLGMTGYSAKENVNNITIPHLHFGLQIIFSEVQKDGTNQIWVDVYNIVNLLEKNRMPVAKDITGKDYMRTIKINNIVTD